MRRRWFRSSGLGGRGTGGIDRPMLRRETFNSADFSIADTKIGSSASFMRFYYQNSTYHPIKRRFSFARSIRIGILRPYRDTISLTFPLPTTQPLPTLIPLPERFFAGGGTSLRGFALNQAGPRDSVTRVSRGRAGAADSESGVSVPDATCRTSARR